MDEGQIAEMAGEEILKDLKTHKKDLPNIVEKEYPQYNLKIKKTAINSDTIRYKVYFITDLTETADGYVVVNLQNNIPVTGRFNIGGVTGNISM